MRLLDRLEEDTMAMIGRRVERKVRARSEEYTPRVTGVDKRRHVWFFEVGDYVVKLRAIPRSKKQQRVERMDVKVRCSCPGWRWNGPEHWAMENKYQYGHPRGTADYPKIRDPDMKHGACKHAMAVFKYVREHKLKIPIMESAESMGELLERLEQKESHA